MMRTESIPNGPYGRPHEVANAKLYVVLAIHADTDILF